MDWIRPAEIATPEFKANPYPYYARLREERPVARTRLFRQPGWLVTRYDDVVTVLKDERFSNDWPARMPWFFRFARPTTRHMLNMDAPDHTRLRALVHKAFTPRLIEHLRARICELCDGLLDAAAVRGGMEVINDYALPLPLTIISELLGIPEEERLRFHGLSRSSLSASTNLDVVRSFPDQVRLLRLIRRLIAKRRGMPGEDLLTAMIEAEEAGDKLSETEMVAMVLLLVLAGYETTVNLIASGTLALVENPEELAKFRENPGIAGTAIEELLRYTSPLEMASARIPREDIRIGGVTIPRGDFVVGVVGSANHDETQFRNPEKLDLMREPNRHVAFGAGSHFCLGAPLARLEGQIALTKLFGRFSELRLRQPAKTLRWRKSLLLRGLEELPVAI